MYLGKSRGGGLPVFRDYGFPSYSVMVSIDFAVVAMTLGLCALCYFKRKSILKAGAGAGVAFLVGGIVAVAALYAADLYTMTLLPLRVGMP